MRFLTHNIGLKLLAVGIAVFLWVIVTGESETVRVYPARVDFVFPEDQVLTGEASGSVSLTLRGPELLLRGVDPAGLTCVVDLRGGESGEQRVPLNPEHNIRGVPRGVAVERISPQILQVSLERKARRAVPVMPRIEGEPPPGCRFAGYDIVPSEVLVEGAESQVASLAMVQTEPIDVSGRCQTFMLSVAASPARPGVRVVSQHPVQVTVRISSVEAPGS
jgi:YbbR domain-containing protein